MLLNCSRTSREVEFKYQKLFGSYLLSISRMLRHPKIDIAKKNVDRIAQVDREVDHSAVPLSDHFNHEIN